MDWIVGLILVGLILISFEIIVPGGVLGFLGGASILGAVGVAYDQYGIDGAFITFLIALVLTIIMLAVELKILPKTKLGARMFLSKTIDSQSTETLGTEDLLGKTGEALTTLAPTGKIVVEGKHFEAFSQDGLINKGEGVNVVGRDNFRILVKKLTQ